MILEVYKLLSHGPTQTELRYGQCIIVHKPAENVFEKQWSLALVVVALHVQKYQKCN